MGGTSNDAPSSAQSNFYSSVNCTNLDDVVADASVRGLKYDEVPGTRKGGRGSGSSSDSDGSDSNDRSEYYIKGCGPEHKIGVGKEDVTCSTLEGSTTMLSAGIPSAGGAGYFCPYGGGNDIAGVAYRQATGCDSVVQRIPVMPTDCCPKLPTSTTKSGQPAMAYPMGSMDNFQRECREFLFPGYDTVAKTKTKNSRKKKTAGKKPDQRQRGRNTNSKSKSNINETSTSSNSLAEVYQRAERTARSEPERSSAASVTFSSDGSSYSTPSFASGSLHPLPPYPLKNGPNRRVRKTNSDDGSNSSTPPPRNVTPPATPTAKSRSLASQDLLTTSGHNKSLVGNINSADLFENDISGIPVDSEDSDIAESVSGRSHQKHFQDSPMGMYSFGSSGHDSSTKLFSNQKSSKPLPQQPFLHSMNMSTSSLSSTGIRHAVAAGAAPLPHSMCDLLVRVGKEEFRHSAAILSYASTYLQQNMVKVEGQQTHQYEIDFSDHSPQSWQIVVEFLHPRSFGKAEITWQILPTVLPWFSRLELDVLLDDADHFLVDTVVHQSTGSLQVRNLLLWLRIALRCNLTRSVEAAQRAIHEKLRKPASSVPSPERRKAQNTSLDNDPTVISGIENDHCDDFMDVESECDNGYQEDITLDWTLHDLQGLATCLVEHANIREDLWESAIIPYLPHDLDVHDSYTLVSNPLFPYLMREGMMQLIVVERARAVLVQAEKHQMDPLLSRLTRPNGSSRSDRSGNSDGGSDCSSMASSVHSSEKQEPIQTLTQDLLHVLLNSTMEHLEQFAQEGEVSTARQRMVKQQQEEEEEEQQQDSIDDVIVTVQDLSMIKEEESYDEMEPPPLRRPRRKNPGSSSVVNRSSESQDRTFEC